MASKSFTRFTEDQLGGSVIVAVFAVVAAICIASLAVRMAYLFIAKSNSTSRECAFFRTQIGRFVINLILANGMNCVAGLLGIPRVIQQGISADYLCLAQAFIFQFGNVSNAYFTSALSLHTFASLVLRKRRPAAYYVSIIAFGWILAGVLAALPLILKGSSGSMYGPTGIACDIRTVYAKEMFLLHLLPIFLAATMAAVCFSLIFLAITGRIVIKGGLKLQLNPDARNRARNSEYHRFITSLARSMLWFPAAYIVFLVPYSVTRLLALGGFTIPFQALIFAFSFWYTLGIVNVMLLYNTFRLVSPVFEERSRDSQDTYSDSSAERGLKRDMAETAASPPFISSMPPTLPYPERAVSVSSYYDYNMQNASNVGKKIAPRSALARESFISGDPARLSIGSSPLVNHGHLGSAEVPPGLPIPPRRPSPPPLTLSNLPPVSPKGKGKAIEDPIRFSAASDLDIAGWLSKQNPDGSMPRGIKNQPMLSAVGRTSFSANELPY